MKKLFCTLLLVLISIGLSTEAFANWAVSIRKYRNCFFQAIEQTTDGNYTLLSSQQGDYWLLKLNRNGDILEQNLLGLYLTQNPADTGLSLTPLAFQQTADDGFVIVGKTKTGGPNRTVILKLDASGNPEWQKYGDYHSWYKAYWGGDVKQTSDGGYIIADEAAEFGASDFDLMKLNANGSFAWRAIYGANDWQQFRSLELTPDNGFILSGDEGYSIDRNLWIVKVNSEGAVEWQKKYIGGYKADKVTSSDDCCALVSNASDGGFIIVGQTNAVGVADVAVDGVDVWVIKIDAAGNIIWQYLYDSTAPGTWRESIYDVKQTSDGGYVLVGKADDHIGMRSSNLWLVKLDRNGQVEWDKVYYGAGLVGRSVDQTEDEGYIIGGDRLYPETTVFVENFIMKVDSEGNIPDCSLRSGEGVRVIEAVGKAEDTFFSQKIIYASSIKDIYAGSETTAVGSSYICEKSNTSPVANAGDNLTIVSEELASTVIQGIATDGDSSDLLACRWLNEETVLLDWTTVGPDGSCPFDLSIVGLGIGTHTLTLEVTDDIDTAEDEMILSIGNSSPNAGCTGVGVYDIFSPITLGASVSDFDGDELTYQWVEGGNVLYSGEVQTISGGDPTALPEYIVNDLSLGEHTLTLIVNDRINEPVVCDVKVTVQDTTDPTLAPVPSTSILWPPNHKFVNITIEANASDNSGGHVALTAFVSSSEPQDGLGDGDTSPDWTNPVIDQYTGVITLQLRAERSGSGEGRVYTIAITAIDEFENSSEALVDIRVPHDKRKKK